MFGKKHTPEACDAISKANKGFPRKPFTPKHKAALSESMKNSDANKDQIKSMRGGGDICEHHYIYDRNDLSLNTVQMTKSDHTKLHMLFQKFGYKVPHINVKVNGL